jgi:aldehyde:ferredoxin oxidoreductase
MKDSAPFGYHGCYLRIDVSDGRVDRVPLPEEVRRQFLGGSGLGAWLLLEEGDPANDAVAPDAPLVFAFSPLVGSPLTTSAKFAVVSKSPLTNRINDSLASSGFAIAGKRSGCDAIVVVGRAAELSVLIVDDGRVRLEAAPELRWATCQATEAALKARLGADYQIASIGPAGERAVRYATISHDGRHAGRGGSGAVLGSKNVKAIAVRGTQRCEWAHPRELTEYSKRLSKRSFGPATAKYRELGTATNLLTFNRLGALPTRNFQSGTFEGADGIAGAHPCRMRTRAAARPAPSAASTSTRLAAKTVRLDASLFALGSLCGERSAPSCAHRSCAMSWASTRSARAARSPSPWVCRTRLARRAVADLRERRRRAARDRSRGPT